MAKHKVEQPKARPMSKAKLEAGSVGPGQVRLAYGQSLETAREARFQENAYGLRHYEALRAPSSGIERAIQKQLGALVEYADHWQDELGSSMGKHTHPDGSIADGDRCGNCAFPVGGFRSFTLKELELKEPGELCMTLRTALISGEIEGQKLSLDVAMNGDLWLYIGDACAILPARTLIEAVWNHFCDHKTKATG